MTNDPEIQDIMNQLQQLQIQQSALIERLEQLNQGHNASENTASSQTVPVRTRQEFAISDRVTIRNPGRFQATEGTLTKIGRSRITVQAWNRSTIVRSPKNLIFVKADPQ
jgi:hypothetical protein